MIVPKEGLARAGLAALLGSTLYLALGVVWGGRAHVLDVPSYDVYDYIYPTFLYAWRSLHERGGLLWNPYQDCGQPFFANSESANLQALPRAYYVTRIAVTPEERILPLLVNAIVLVLRGRGPRWA